jgi:Cu(I)/Ag(I) efflux system membrane fusion protein
VRRIIGVLLVCAAGLAAGFYLGRTRTPVKPRARTILYYVDPMHPSYHSAKPGIAPDCGMELVPVYEGDVAATQQMPASTESGLVHIDPATRQLYGITLATVEQTSGRGNLRVYGRVAADESRVFHVDLGTEGYVKDTHADAVGDHVSKNQHLATVYSPEFLSLAGGYLSANERSTPGNSHDAAGQSPSVTATQSQNASGAQARADRLRNAGMSDVQIEEIRANQKIPEDVYVVSPTDGFIIAREISPGMRFERHTELYTIADLNHIWILADAFGKDALAFRSGSIAQITLPDTGEHFVARVSNVLPELNATTRALQPRLELSNPGFHLRPGMFVDVDVSTAPREGLTIPSDAIVNTGLSKRVYVEIGENTFQARVVETGWTEGDRVQIVRGLRKGDKVVSSGTFLIDSESRMHQAGE